MPRINGEAPSQNNPVANFDADTYRWIAELPNQDFINLRNSVMGMSGSDARTRALKASFYSNGVTGVPDGLQSDAVWNAAAQHDFRYTIGPNVMSGADMEQDRAAADSQFHQDVSTIRNLRTGYEWLDNFLDPIDGAISRGHADVKWGILRLLGKSNYSQSPVNHGVSFREAVSELGWPGGSVSGRSGLQERSLELQDDVQGRGDGQGWGDDGGDGQDEGDGQGWGDDGGDGQGQGDDQGGDGGNEGW
ncbi:hypothetical protein ACFVSN_43345 [Kitasatospora sp. NPDC057904]|uniref:hypothetical protein n=1 Tax=unclassified Kitasatospora TaxID=2633591 RepID=UPI0036DDE120